MKNYLKLCFRYYILSLLTFTLYVNAASVNSSHPIRLSDHVPDKVTAKATFLGKFDSPEPIPFTFILPLRNQEELKNLIQRLYDPNDKAYYGKYLSTSEFNDRFAPTQEDYDKVIDYAKSIGLSIIKTHPNCTLLSVAGTPSTIERSFNISLDHYQLSSGRKFYAPNNNPEVPASIASVISGIVGLDNHALWRPFYRIRETLGASSEINLQSHAGPGGGYSPADISAAYNVAGIPAKGAGQVIALFELGSYQLSDITTYTTQFGLPSPKLKNVLVDGGSTGGINAEVTLDIELALALAPESEIYVYEGPNTNQGVLDTYNKIATDNIAKQVSTSWGLAEDLSVPYLQAENAIFQQMAAHGQTIYAAAGDSGAYDNYPSSQELMVDDPACQPYVVGVGGTRLTVNPDNSAYVAESVWNNGLGVGAGGGGVSKFWPIPAWQANIPTASSKTHRNVPDVCLNSDTNTGYAIYHNSRWMVFGGTSCAAPLWAAFTALVNQELAAHQKSPLGFANPALYAILTTASYPANFHDVTSGDNLFYKAGSGYDNATGLGSFNGINLFTTLTNSAPIIPPIIPPGPPPVLAPRLNVVITHSPGIFTKNGIGTYVIRINNTGNSPTSGQVNVSISLPVGLKPQFLSGTGWKINPSTLTCASTGTLQPGAGFPLIILTTKVGRNAHSTVTPTVTVWGGAAATITASDPTTVKNKRS